MHAVNTCHASPVATLNIPASMVFGVPFSTLALYSTLLQPVYASQTMFERQKVTLCFVVHWVAISNKVFTMLRACRLRAYSTYPVRCPTLPHPCNPGTAALVPISSTAVRDLSHFARARCMIALHVVFHKTYFVQKACRQYGPTTESGPCVEAVC